MAQARKITIEVEVPADLPGVDKILRDIVERTLAYMILQAKARDGPSDEEIAEAVRETRRKVWERVRDAYTRR